MEPLEPEIFRNGIWYKLCGEQYYPCLLPPEPEQPKATGNGGMLLLALAVVVIGGGAGWYFKIYRPKKQRAAESEADYGGEYDGAEDYDETAPEDDGPPWDEDGEE